MWQIELKCKLKDSKLIKAIYSATKDKYKDDNTIIALVNNEKSTSMSVAMKDEENPPNRLINMIAKNIVVYYKKQALRSEIWWDNVPQDFRDTLLSVLVMFDIEDDITCVLAEIINMRSIDINSLYYFRMKDLIIKWQDLISVVNESVCSMLNQDGFLEILRFLVSVNESQCSVVNIYHKDSGFEVYDENNRIVCEHISEETKLLSSLIKLSPLGINLHCIDNLTNTMFKTMYYIFDKRINLKI